MPPVTIAWAYAVLAAVLVVAAVIDVRTGRVPNYLTYPAVAIALIGHTLTGGLTGRHSPPSPGLAGALIGLAAGFLPLLVAWLMGGIGGGDVKLMGAVGALAGWQLALSTLFYGFLAVLGLCVAIMIRRRVLKRTLLRVGRFLLLAWAPGGAHYPASVDSPKVPFALGLCIGGLVALAEVIARGGRTPWLLGG